MLSIHTGNMKQDIDSDTLHMAVCKLNKHQSEDNNIFCQYGRSHSMWDTV